VNGKLISWNEPLMIELGQGQAQVHQLAQRPNTQLLAALHQNFDVLLEARLGQRQALWSGREIETLGGRK
jgi:hypothetical protein